MAKISKTAVDKALRTSVFTDFLCDPKDRAHEYVKINDRQYGTIITDVNGHKRYVRIGVIVTEEREDMTAEELMQIEINEYQQKQADKAEKAKAKENKIAKDKARREAEAKAKQEGVSES